MEQLIWRPWREIARELAVECDPYRILELCNELSAAATVQRSVPDGGRQPGRPLPDRTQAAKT